MQDARLDQPQEWIGNWWRPENPKSTSAGVLSYDPEKGLELRLIGGWRARASTEVLRGILAGHNEPERWPLIHGTSGDRKLTLVEPWAASSRGVYGDEPVEMTLRAFTLLDGCHLDAPDSSAFVGASVSVENLTGWVQRGHAEMNLHRPIAKTSTDEDRSDTKATSLVGDVEVSLYTSSGLQSWGTRRDGGYKTERTEATVAFSAKEPRSMASWFSLVQGVSDLVSLSTMSACADIAIQLFLPAAAGRAQDEEQDASGIRVVDVYQQHVVRPDPDGRAAGWSDFILTEADLPWAELFPAWMNVRERFASARSMILGLRYVTGGYLETRVVTAVGAAEAFHRALDTPPPIEPAEFEALRRLLLGSVPKERKSWLNDRIQWNEVSLKQRLVDLATRPGPFMSDLVNDPSEWARAAVRARNDLAHRGATGHDDYELLHAVVEVTAAVVVMNLLREVGVPVQRLEVALNEHPEFRAAAALARNHFTKSRG